VMFPSGLQVVPAEVRTQDCVQQDRTSCYSRET
jgi:hypothetical protein